jgi:beta-lactam-binding protein with PASTA domain
VYDVTLKCFVVLLLLLLLLLLAAVAGAVAGTGVPAGTSSVVYDVTLKSFVKAKEKWEMNNQEKVSVCFGKLSHTIML